MVARRSRPDKDGSATGPERTSRAASGTGPRFPASRSARSPLGLRPPTPTLATAIVANTWVGGGVLARNQASCFEGGHENLRACSLVGATIRRRTASLRGSRLAINTGVKTSARLFSTIAALVVSLASCGGSSALKTDGSAGNGGSAGATGSAGGGPTGICNGGCLCFSLKTCPAGCYVTPGGDCQNGANPDGTSIRVPSVHRSVGTICPATRGPGSICTGPGVGTAQCAKDSDCATGKNGRCSSSYGPLADCTPSCSYDACQGDSDCPARVPCECRDSATSESSNECVMGGNCAVDTDCGPGGFCSPGVLEGLCEHPIYFCHTPKDTCTDAFDCPALPSGAPQKCNYDMKSGHFACGSPCFPPP